MQKKYEIPESNITYLDVKLKKLNKSAKKLGVSETTYTIIGEKFEQIPDPAFTPESGRKLTIKKLILDVNFGEIPVLEGWSFIAKINHDPVIGNTVNTVPGEEYPIKYRNSGANCEHCGHKRIRKNTYICKHVDGKFIQVGSTCLRDFLGHTNPKYIIHASEDIFTAMDLFSTTEKDFVKGVRPEIYEHFVSFLILSAKCIRENGWMSKAAVNKILERDYDADVTPTIDIIVNELCPTPEILKTLTYPIKEDEELAKKVAEWAKTLYETNKSDYAFNASQIANAGYLTYKHMALAASLIASYKKAMEKEEESKQKNNLHQTSKYFGEVKTRYDMTLTILGIRELGENKFDQIQFLIRFTDGDNLFSWFTTSYNGDLDIGKTYKVKATVKKHNEFKGSKTTILSRVKFIKEL